MNNLIASARQQPVGSRLPATKVTCRASFARTKRSIASLPARCKRARRARDSGPVRTLPGHENGATRPRLVSVLVGCVRTHRRCTSTATPLLKVLSFPLYFRHFVEFRVKSSQVYCHGPLLHTIQTAELYHDSKTFVDKKLRYHPDHVTLNFTQLMGSTNNTPTKQDLINFINEHFESEGSEFTPWDPSDWIKNPSFLKKINNTQLRQWGQQLNEAWKFLGRKIKGAFHHVCISIPF